MALPALERVRSDLFPICKGDSLWACCQGCAAWYPASEGGEDCDVINPRLQAAGQLVHYLMFQKRVGKLKG
jgi:hypothetical protein